MEIWIAFTLAAVFFQTARFALQKRLKTAGLSAAGATWVRFLWSAPLMAVGMMLLTATTGTELPPLSTRFWIFALAGGIGQILATICVVALFSRRNFAVGITLKKSEVLLTALVGWLVLGEATSGAGLAALALGAVALLMLSKETAVIPPPGQGALRRLVTPSAALGLTSGIFFALAGVAYRGAMLSLGDAPLALRAAWQLTLITGSQALLMLAWFLWRDRGQIARVLAAWRPGLALAAASMAGSFCWFSAFALQNAAYVYAVGQTELIFSILGGALFFGERLSRREYAGAALLTVSVVVLVLVV
ncbi:DMT family transporter [Tropicimonas sp. IMCC6043]|uniref:DMT family transporter n=1 Tax=Tropicimonas sp. IMCC6043 TaxID=2510645 RepID=UPI00101B6DA1|nr:DMT family transporter [Tropicimonas sp. IMCC6043]RYH11636.1 DMT family transporter [Tropicimonas sp. IMCC6043]